MLAHPRGAKTGGAKGKSTCLLAAASGWEQWCNERPERFVGPQPTDFYFRASRAYSSHCGPFSFPRPTSQALFRCTACHQIYPHCEAWFRLGAVAGHVSFFPAAVSIWILYSMSVWTGGRFSLWEHETDEPPITRRRHPSRAILDDGMTSLEAPHP